MVMHYLRGLPVEHKPMPFKAATLLAATARARNSIIQVSELAKAFEEDAHKGIRFLKSECKVCFYTHKIGAQAFTTRECACCGVDQVYGHSATDVLCVECSVKHSLCKHCGGDIDLQLDRDWEEITGGK